MIHCNLATLLAQRHMKIAKIHQDTRISRTTLTSLAYGHAQGIQFDTLNTLCTYLNVSAADMILHLPIDIIWEKKVYSESSHVRYDTVILTIKERGTLPGSMGFRSPCSATPTTSCHLITVPSKSSVPARMRWTLP